MAFDTGAGLRTLARNVKRIRELRQQRRSASHLERLEERRLLATWGGTLAADTTWSSSEVQTITSDLTIPEGVTLTIDPATVVKFGHWTYDIFVAGSIVADGTEESPIVFTEFHDDVGGDTNGDGAASMPAPNNWGRIEISATGNGNFKHTQMRYGGWSSPGQLTVIGGQLTLRNSVLQHSNSDGLRIQNSDPVLSGTVFSNNRDAAISMDLASNPDIQRVLVSDNGINGLQVDGGTIAEDAFWNDADITYWLNGDISVAAGQTLTVDAGQVVKFGYWTYDLFVDGTLVANGTAERPVVFTERHDDTAGGDTNNDGTTSTPVRNNWGRIELRGPGSQLNHVDIRYGGWSSQGELVVNGGELTLSNSTLQHSNSDGLNILNSDPTLTNNVFRDNRDAAAAMDLASNPVIQGIVTSGNGVNGLQVAGGTIEEDAFWDDPDITYWLNGDISVAADQTLTVGAGQVVKFGYWTYDLFVDGTLVANGTVERPVVFTERHDDTAGGDTNNDGTATAPVRNNWGRIELRGPGSQLNHVDIRYGGWSSQGELVVNGGELTLSNSTLQHSNSDGLNILNSDPTLRNNVFRDNRDAAAAMDLASNPDIQGVITAQNGINGLQVAGGTIAAGAFWNDPDITYWLNGDIAVAADTTLTVGAGQVVKFGHWTYDLQVDGTLVANGTVERPIVFTEPHDDTAGGDTNNDGATTTPARNNWGRIELRGPGNQLNHLDVRYGGWSSLGQLVINGGDTTLTNSLLRESNSDAIHVVAGSANVSNSLLVSNRQEGIETKAGVNLTAVNNTIHDNHFGIWIAGADVNAQLVNNIISGSRRAGIGAPGGTTAPPISFNIVHNPNASVGNYEGLPDLTGTNENKDSDPQYFSADNLQFQLRSGSPALDSADGNLAPATDRLERPRFDGPNVLDTGTGPIPFADRGAFERQQDSSSNVDLNTVEVVGVESGVQGDSAAISWTVRNVGIEPAYGLWHDAIYLSVDPFWSVDDILLDEFLHEGGLGPGQTYTTSGDVALPGVLPGDYHFIVRSDARNGIFEGLNEPNNARASKDTISLDLPTLLFDLPREVQLDAPNDALFFRLPAPAGGDIKIEVDGPEGTTSEVYVKFDDLPSRQAFQFRGARIGEPDQVVSFGNSMAGNYYVMLRGVDIPAEGETLTLTATLQGFGVEGVFPFQGANIGTVTVTVDGAQFNSGSQLEMVTSSGATIVGTDSYFEDTGRISATFDLAGAALGLADIRVMQAGGESSALADAFNIIEGVPGRLSVRLTGPNRVRLRRTYELTVEYANEGDTDLLVPIMRLASRGLTTLSLDPELVGAKTEVSLLAVNSRGPAGILAPGGRGRITVFASMNARGTENYDVFVGDYPDSPIDWVAAKPLLRPEELPQQQWDEVYPQIQTAIGSSWSDYHDVISRTATQMTPQQGNNASLVDVFGLTVEESLGERNTSVSGSLRLGLSGAPLPGVPIELYDASAGAAAFSVSRADGSFVFPDVEPGSYVVSLDKFIAQDAPRIVVEEADITDVLISAETGATISGRVIIASHGIPIRDELVIATSESGETFATSTDRDGHFTIDTLPAGTFSLTAGGTAFTRGSVEGIVIDQGENRRNVTLPLDFASRISGSVIGPDAPLSGAVVLATGGDGAVFTAVTDDNGQYAITGLSGQQYAVSVSAEGLAAVELGSVDVPAGGVVNGVNATLTVGGSIAGTVKLLADNSPAPSGYVLIENDEQNRTAQVDENGAFRLEAIPVGVYNVSFLSSNLMRVTQDSVTVAASAETSIDLLTTPLGRVAGKVTSATSGDPLGNVTVFAADESGFVASTVADSAGNYALEGIETGDFRIAVGEAGTPGVNSANVEISLANPTATVDFEIEVVGVVSGTVVQSDGLTPVSDATVTLLEGGTEVVSTATNVRGAFSFVLLNPGTFDIRADAADFHFAPATGITVTSGIETPAQVITAGSGVVEGVVTSLATGAPLEGVAVLIDRIDGAGTRSVLGTLLSGPDGRFSALSVAPGNYQAIASRNGFGYSVASFQVSNETLASLSVSLGPEAILSGAVTSEDGSPMANGSIEIYDRNNASIRFAGESDEQGAYRIAGLNASNYDVVVRADERASVTLEAMPLNVGLNKANFVLLSAEASISGTVVGEIGPIANVNVVAFIDNDRVMATTRSASDGSYTLASLGAGSYTIRANVTGYRSVASMDISVADGQHVTVADIAMVSLAVPQLQLPAAAEISTVTLNAIQNLLGEGQPNRQHPTLEELEAFTCHNVFTINVFDPTSFPNKKAEFRIESADRQYKWLVETDAALRKELGEFTVQVNALAQGLRNTVSHIKEVQYLTGWNFDYRLPGEPPRFRPIKEIGSAFEGIVSFETNFLSRLREMPNARDFETTSRLLLGTGFGSDGIESPLIAARRQIRDLRNSLAAKNEGWSDYYVQMWWYRKAIVKNLDKILANIPDNLSVIHKSLQRAAELANAKVRYDDAAKEANQAFALVKERCLKKKGCPGAGSQGSGAAPADHRGDIQFADDLEFCPLPSFDPALGTPGNTEPNPIFTTVQNIWSGLLGQLGVGSFDPNDKLGPSGFGDSGYTQPGLFPFEIQFENDPELGATAPAQEVSITDTLDENFNLATFEFGGFGFNNFEFSVPPGLPYYTDVIDLRPDGIELLVDVGLELNYNTREITATFSSLDPLTLLLPDDVDAGFLPVNDKELHNGEGFIRYRVETHDGLPTGTEITNFAEIVFDTNDPILTPQTLHTIDRDRPTSRVKPLPTTSEAASFPVSWEGDDGDGSGIGSFDIYVAADGGPFEVWLRDTSESSATFEGQSGKSYAFYSIATDTVGIAELNPDVADATIRIEGIAGVAGDFNGDLLVNINDIDALQAQLATGLFDARFDLSKDGMLDGADLEHLVQDILNTRRGDANLDGRVDFTDFLLLSSNFNEGNASWSIGDFDLDGTVGFADFLALSTNFGFVRP